MSTTDKPIGIFDSGLGGLTVARAIAKALPSESMLYVGDTKRCPYGPRPQAQVRAFVRQIGEWFVQREVKFVVIACNTATAAGLDVLQTSMNVPAIGVITPGARAAIQATRNRRVGVLATHGTLSSKAYPKAIQALDAGVQVIQAEGMSLVEIVEGELISGQHLTEDWLNTPSIFDTLEVHTAVAECVAPFKDSNVDTVVLGCTHYPLLYREIKAALGDDVRIVSSAEETCREVAETLTRRGDLCSASTHERPSYRFATTSDNITEFAVAGQFIFGHPLDSIEHISLDSLEALA